MNETLLSIVIPAFNVERFIERCISSVTQHVAAERVEIIVVNDGSTDSTREILEGLSATNRLRVIHQSNSGLGAARNCGLLHAKGEYVWFVDSDDFLPDESLTTVLADLDLRTPDVLVVDFSCADEGGQYIKWVACPFRRDHGRVMTGAEFFRRYFATTYAWLYVIRRSLLERNRLQFQPRMNMQDAELLPRIMAVSRTVFVSGIDAYTYVKREGSFINSRDQSVRERYFRSVLEVRWRLMKFLQEANDPALCEGIVAKLSSVDRILLRAYVYDSLDQRALSGRLSLLREERVHPFARQPGASVKDRLLRAAVNARPLLAPRVYSWLRSRTLLRKIASFAWWTRGAA